MAKDLLKVLNEIRGTGEPEAAYTDGIYYDIVGKTTEADNVTQRLAPGMYGSIQVMYNGVGQVLLISDAITALSSITTALSSLYTDKMKLDSIYADKITLDSLYADKLTLDSIYADKSKLDSLYLDKAKLDSLYADKIKLDSLFADKATLDSLVTDKVKLDSIYADKAKLDSLYADKITLDSLYAALASINTVSTNIVSVNTVSGAIANVNTVATNIADINTIVTSIIPNLAEILLADDNAALVSNLYDQFDDRYLGSKSVEPAVDNDGNVLLVGALYFDSVLNKMREWTGLQWQDALTLTAGSISTLTNKTLDSITNQVGADHIHYKVRNNTASIIPIGTVVTASDTQPGTDYINVLPITDPQTQIAIGVVHTTLAINGSGLVINTGIADDFNTNAWTIGTILYPNTTGGFTTIKPITGIYQACAIVLRQHLTQGTLLCEFTNPAQIASTTQTGYVQLNNTLTSTSIVQALTAAQGKVLQDRLVAVENGTVQEGDSVTLTGDVTGTAVFDANGNVSITTTVVDDSHAHIIANVDGLQIALDSKVDENAAIVAGTATKITYDAKGLVTAGTTLVATDIPVLDASKVTTGTLPVLRGGTGVTTSTGTGSVVLNTSPTLVTPTLGVATGTSFNAITGLATIAPVAPAVTAAVGTSTTVARQDHVHPTNFTATATDIKMNGAQAVGTLVTFPRADHVHPTDTSRAALASPTFTGTPAAPTASTGTNTTQLATTAFVQTEITNNTYSKTEVLQAIGNINAPLLDMPLKNSLAMKAGVGSATFTRASTATYIDRYGVLKTAAVDEPRFEKEGYLNEGTSTNLVLNSAILVTQNVTVTATTYTLSFYDVGTVTLSGAYVDSLVGTGSGNRVTLTFLATAGTLTLTVSGSVLNSQLEALPFATSYIPTVASTVTRAADSLTLSADGNYNLPADKKTILIDYDILGYGSVNQNLFDLTTTSQSNRILSFVSTMTAPNQRPACYYSGSPAAFGTSAVPANTKNRLACLLPSGTATQSVTRYFNGVFYAAGSQTIVANLAPTTLYIGRNNNILTSNHFGHISNVRVYDKALTATEIALA